jgi:iron(III) transport system ATP-binding protein
LIEIEGLSRFFASDDGAVSAVNDLSLHIKEGEFFVLLGPSGSGKTTLLRCIAGLERPDEGTINLNGQCVFSGERRLFVGPEKRRLGMIFQNYALWPHMTVYNNVARPLREGWRKLPKAYVPERVQRALKMVGIEQKANRPAPLLSGGEQQRVALARALALEPSILLMDEPLSNLDARLRDSVREQIKELTQRLGVTVVYVTHDQEEALYLADRIAVMRSGRIAQIGTTRDVYLKPNTKDLAEFMGDINWVPGTVLPNGDVETPLGAVSLSTSTAAALADRPGREVSLGLRPSVIEVLPDGHSDEDASKRSTANRFVGQVISSTFLGEHVSYVVESGGVTLEILAPWDWPEKEVLSFRLRKGAILVFDTETGERFQPERALRAEDAVAAR